MTVIAGGDVGQQETGKLDLGMPLQYPIQILSFYSHLSPVNMAKNTDKSKKKAAVATADPPPK